MVDFRITGLGSGTPQAITVVLASRTQLREGLVGLGAEEDPGKEPKTEHLKKNYKSRRWPGGVDYDIQGGNLVLEGTFICQTW